MGNNPGTSKERSRNPKESSMQTRPFPSGWKLIPREAEMLALFETDAIVPHAALEAVIANYRVGPKGRPLKVHLHYLREKLAPRGIRIESVYGRGFRLAAEARETLAPYFADGEAARSAAVRSVAA
jgi:DNA-binding response OmpR family regulator